MAVKHHKIVLSLPPSVNHAYHQRRGGGRFLTDEARGWKQEAVLKLRLLHITPYLPTQKVVVEAFVQWPDNRRRDCDNLAKLTQDFIQESGLVADDRYLLWRVIDWMVVPKKGCLQLTIYAKE